MTATKDDGLVEDALVRAVVAIDPGHGGRRGCIVGSLVEDDWVLEVGKMLEAALLERPGIAPTLLRDSDEALPNSERRELVRDLEPDLVISLHVNANEDPTVNGMWAFHWPGDELGEAVGTAIEAAAPAEVRPRSARSSEAKIESWPRVRNVLALYAGRPAVLVECGFATNPQDNAEMQREDVKRAIVAACVTGVVRFLAG